MPHAILVLCIVLLVSGCHNQVEPGINVDTLIKTEFRSYTLKKRGNAWATEIAYTFENRTGGSVYIPNCKGQFGLYLEQLKNSSWEMAWAPFQQTCQSNPIIIEEGAVFADTLHVWGAFPGENMLPQFNAVDSSGTYRLVWEEALSSYDDRALPAGRVIDLNDRTSHEFEMRIGTFRKWMDRLMAK